VTGHPFVGVSIPDICNGVSIFLVLVTFLASWRERWRERQRGRRVELWSDDAARMKALREAGASPAVAEQIIQGNKINAIKECRLETGLGLKEAKDAVERYQDALYRYEPWNTFIEH
jgi:ribosomal protein L7/L12